MKLPWNKSKRGVYRTTRQRVTEQKDLVDEHLMKAWMQDLKEHPEYTRQIIRQKFGLSDTGGGDDEGGYTEPSFTDQLLEVQRAKGAMDNIFGGGGGGKGSGFIGLISDLINADKDGQLATALAGVITLFAEKMGQVQVGHVQQVQQDESPAQLKEPETKEEKLTRQVQVFLALPPEQAAIYLYENQEVEGSVEAYAWNMVLGSSVDKLLGMVPDLESMPQFSCLIPYVQKLSTKEGKTWLSLLIDECTKLNSPEIPPEPSEVTEEPPKPPEITVNEPEIPVDESELQP